MFLFIILVLQFLGTLTVDPRAVEINLETSFLFRPSDVHRRNSVLNNIKAFLSSVDRRLRAKEPKFRTQDGELTTFVQFLGRKLVKFDEDRLRNITIAIRSTINDYYNRSKLKSVFDNKALKNFVISLSDWDKMPIKDIKGNIRYVVDNDNTILHKLIRFADRFYNETDTANLQSIAAAILRHKNQKDLKKDIKRALNFIVFKRIKILSDKEKVKLYKGLHKIIHGYNNFIDTSSSFLDSKSKMRVENENIKQKFKEMKMKAENKETTQKPNEFDEEVLNIEFKQRKIAHPNYLAKENVGTKYEGIKERAKPNIHSKESESKNEDNSDLLDLNKLAREDIEWKIEDAKDLVQPNNLVKEKIESEIEGTTDTTELDDDDKESSMDVTKQSLESEDKKEIDDSLSKSSDSSADELQIEVKDRSKRTVPNKFKETTIAEKEISNKKEKSKKKKGKKKSLTRRLNPKSEESRRNSAERMTREGELLLKQIEEEVNNIVMNNTFN